MVYQISFSRADRWSQLPYLQLLNSLENNGRTLKLEVVVNEEDMSVFEEELGRHLFIKRWRRIGGSQWSEVTTTFRKPRRRLPS